MYNNEIYPIRYPVDSFYNGEADYDYYGTPPGHHYPQPTPCPEYPPMPPMPPMPPIPPMPPMHPVPPMPPMDSMPGMGMQCLMHLKGILEKLKHKKASLIIEGAKDRFDCIKIMSVDHCMLVVETKSGVCVIPLADITALCMSKELAEEVLMDKK